MSEIWSPLVGALAVTLIPLFGWFSKRVTREGRLLLRVGRLGAVYVLLPSSPERDVFERRLNSAVNDLNEWVDPDRISERRVVTGLSLAVYVGGIAVFASRVWISGDYERWSAPFGFALGLATVAVTFATSFVMARRSQKKLATAKRASESAAAAIRMEALRKGEPVEEK